MEIVGAVFALKFAVTVVSLAKVEPSIVIDAVVAVDAPDQPVNLFPLSAVAVRLKVSSA